jgi:hypothetical protein
MWGARVRQLLREVAKCRLDQRDYRRLEGTREAVGDQRNILLSVTQIIPSAEYRIICTAETLTSFCDITVC